VTVSPTYWLLKGIRQLHLNLKFIVMISLGTAIVSQHWFVCIQRACVIAVWHIPT